jgi:hypothetical protein
MENIAALVIQIQRDKEAFCRDRRAGLEFVSSYLDIINDRT